MWNRKELKKQGKISFKRNFWKCIAVCLVITALIGGTLISAVKEVGYESKEVHYNISHVRGKTNSDIVNEFIEQGNQGKETEPFMKATAGVLANVTNNVSKSGSFLFGVLNALNQMLFKDHVFAGIIIIVGAILTFLYWFFVSFILEIGRSRFFLENRRYGKTKLSKILLPYHVKRTVHLSCIMLKRKIYTFLWSLTIVGAFIKHYSYLMIPYVLAENPTLSSKEAFLLSREMMHGYKWKTFCLDCSYFWWYLLSALTLNVASLLYVSPYLQCTYAEVYLFVRKEYKKKCDNQGESLLLCDAFLEGNYQETEAYPKEEYLIKSHERRKWKHLDYLRNYSWVQLILLFFLFSICGFIWEVLLELFQSGNLVNRGTLMGPWLPIYGSGGVLILIFLKKYREKPLTMFLLAMLLCTVIEYGTSCYLEIVHHMKWWDYTGYLLNINGRVCLEASLFFGLGGCAFIYIFSPLVVSKLEKISEKWQKAIALLLVLLMFVDFNVSSRQPNAGKGVTYPSEKQKEIQENIAK